MRLTRAFVFRIVRYVLVSCLILIALAYVGDYVSVRLRMRHPKLNDPLETITAVRLLAIGEKGNKTEYMVDQVQPQQTGVCVHSLFPHFGNPPCWYLKRKFAQPIPMAILMVPRRWN